MDGVEFDAVEFASLALLLRPLAALHCVQPYGLCVYLRLALVLLIVALDDECVETFTAAAAAAGAAAAVGTTAAFSGPIAMTALKLAHETMEGDPWTIGLTGMELPASAFGFSGTMPFEKGAYVVIHSFSALAASTKSKANLIHSPRITHTL